LKTKLFRKYGLFAGWRSDEIYGIMSVKQTLYHGASGFRVHRENPGAQISRRGIAAEGCGIMSVKQTLYHGASGFCLPAKSQMPGFIGEW
jgi:hypothetical protein